MSKLEYIEHRLQNLQGLINKETDPDKLKDLLIKYAWLYVELRELEVIYN
jgi:hypothetical protein